MVEHHRRADETTEMCFLQFRRLEVQDQSLDRSGYLIRTVFLYLYMARGRGTERGLRERACSSVTAFIGH
jgi:hypothetical protein